MTRPRLMLLALALAFFAAACGFALPAARRALVDREAMLERFLVTEQAAYDALLGRSRIPRIMEIAEREQIRTDFPAAALLLAKAKQCALNEPLGNGDAGRCSLLLDQADAAIRKPRRRLEAWTRLWAAPGPAAEVARASVTRVELAIAAVVDPQSAVAQRLAAQAVAYPDKRVDLERRAATLAAAPAELDRTLANVESELSRLRENQGDIAAFERALRDVDTLAQTAQFGIGDLGKRIAELDVDDEVVLVRLEKVPEIVGPAFYATTRTYRNGNPQPEVRVPIDSRTFTKYVAIVIGLQQLFPDQRVIVSQPPVTLFALCAFALNVDVDVVIGHKAVGQYADEMSDAPSPPAIALGYVGHPSYGTWQVDPDGRKTWQWNAMWSRLHANEAALASVRDDTYAKYSAWRSRPLPELAALYCPIDDDEPSRVAIGGMRGIGPHIRSRGMGGGGK